MLNSRSHFYWPILRFIPQLCDCGNHCSLYSIQLLALTQNWDLFLQFLLRCLFLKWISREAASYLFFCSLCRRNIIEAVYNRLNPYREEDGVSVRIWDWIWVVFPLSDSLLPNLSDSLVTKILLRLLLYLHTSVFWSFKGIQSIRLYYYQIYC